MKQKIIIGVVAFFGLAIIVGGSVFAALYFTGALNDDPDMAAAESMEEMLPENTYYYSMQPEFVVNFQGKSRTKFLMIEMTAATHDEEVLVVLSDHDPELRNVVLDLLSEQEATQLATAEGKQVLRESALSLINEIVERHYEPEKVHDIFITRLVMQ